MGGYNARVSLLLLGPVSKGSAGVILSPVLCRWSEGKRGRIDYLVQELGQVWDNTLTFLETKDSPTRGDNTYYQGSVEILSLLLI